MPNLFSSLFFFVAAAISYIYAGTVERMMEIEHVETVMEIFAAVLAFLAIWTLLGAAWRRFSYKFTVKGSRIIRQYGIISRNQQSVRIEDLRSIELSQTVLQRILNVGVISFYSAGSASAEVVFFGVKGPAELKQQINDMMGERKSSNC